MSAQNEGRGTRRRHRPRVLGEQFEDLLVRVLDRAFARYLEHAFDQRTPR